MKANRPGILKVQQWIFIRFKKNLRTKKKGTALLTDKKEISWNKPRRDKRVCTKKESKMCLNCTSYRWIQHSVALNCLRERRWMWVTWLTSLLSRMTTNNRKCRTNWMTVWWVKLRTLCLSNYKNLPRNKRKLQTTSNLQKIWRRNKVKNYLTIMNSRTNGGWSITTKTFMKNQPMAFDLHLEWVSLSLPEGVKGNN